MGKLIGISASHAEDAVKIGELIHPTFIVKRYRDEIEKFAARVIGFTEEQMRDTKLMASYLGEEWSYTRNERFVDPKEGVLLRPVKYHITPAQVVQRIMYLGREIHSQFWVNALYASWDADVTLPHWVVIDCLYPNEADAIVDREGILVRVDRHERKKGVDYLVSHPGITRRFNTDGSDKSLSLIADEILKL